MKDEIEWLNFRWGLDVQYTLKENAPILAQMITKNKNFFWHDAPESPDSQIRRYGYCYRIQGDHVILRWPAWRNHYRVDMEKVRIRKNQSNKQRRLSKYLEVTV
jgi:hypothetical protein